MTFLETEESKRWNALDQEARTVDSVESFSVFTDKIIETLESSPEVMEDFQVSDFIESVAFKCNQAHREFSSEDRQDEMFKRCIRWFAVVMADAASAGNFLRKEVYRD